MAKHVKSRQRQNNKNQAQGKKRQIRQRAEKNTQTIAEKPQDLSGASHIEAQATKLGDARVPLAQRRAMAGNIGRVAGNQYLQRVVSQMRDDQRIGALTKADSASINGRLKPVTMAVQRADKGKSVAPSKIKTEQIEYEVIAHKFAYAGKQLPPAAGKWLVSRGYKPNWTDTVDGIGCFAGLLMPLKSKEQGGRMPIIAFKGTDNFGDLMADLDPVAVGFLAFQHNKDEVAGLISKAGGRVDITGHSLGGALTQHAVSNFSSSVRKAITFQSPAVNTLQAKSFEKIKNKPEIIHHIVTGDAVDLAGGKHLAGKFYLHHAGKSPNNHRKFLLCSDIFKKERQKAGLDEATLKALGIKDYKAEHTGKITSFKSYPFRVRQFFMERIREVGAILTVGHHYTSAGLLGAKKAGSAIAKGARAVGRGVKRGAIAVGQGVKKGAIAVGRGAKATIGFFKKMGSKGKAAASSALTKVSSATRKAFNRAMSRILGW